MIRTTTNDLEQAMPVTQPQAAYPTAHLKQQETSVTSLPESLVKNYAAYVAPLCATLGNNEEYNRVQQNQVLNKEHTAR